MLSIVEQGMAKSNSIQILIPDVKAVTATYPVLSDTVGSKEGRVLVNLTSTSEVRY